MKFLSYEFAGLKIEAILWEAAQIDGQWVCCLHCCVVTQHHVAEVWNCSQNQHWDKYSVFPFTPHFSFLFYQDVCFQVDPSNIPANDRQLSLEGQEK